MSNSRADVPAPHVPSPGDGVMPAPDLAALRARFSSLSGDFVYLDAPGGTQTPDEVGAAAAQVYLEASGNTGAPYATSRRLEALVDDARAASARFFGCAPEEIIFGANMTSLNFTLSRTLGRELRAGDEIVVTRLDHDGNVAPWLDLASDLGFGVWNHGSYYALGLHDRIGWGEALRVGLAHYNSPDEIDRFNEALASLVAAHATEAAAAGQP